MSPLSGERRISAPLFSLEPDGSEERANSRRFALQVGPSSVALEGGIDPDRWPLDVAHDRFIQGVAMPQVTLAVHCGATGSRRGSPAFKVGEIASLYRDGNSWTFCVGEEGVSSRADRVLTLDASGRTGTLALDANRSPELAHLYPLEYPLEDLLFRHLLSERRALIVHGCGVVWKGEGYLFVGSSGSGKSTTARLWKAAGASILNDDRIVVEASPERIIIHPTPWFGEELDVGDSPAPLTRLYLLRKGPQVSFQPIRPANAAALILAKSFPPLWDPDRTGRVLETLDSICRKVPCGWLTVPPEHRAVGWVQET